MDTVLIETFLSVVYNRNVTHAANQLYVSQSTVSSRLQQLEAEVGATLIERRKGFRNIELTPLGFAFVPIAQRYAHLDQEIKHFSTQEHRLDLTIACPDSLNVHLFRPLYEELIHSSPHVDLRIRTHQSPEIYNMINNLEADVGFVFHQSRYKNIIAEEVIQEKMVLLVSSKGDWPQGSIHPSQLDPSYELYLAWSDEIVRWHDYWWRSNVHPYAQVDTASMLVRFMGDSHCWTLCPVSVAMAYLDNPDILIRECAEKIPFRKSYMLTERRNLESEEIQLFRKYFFTYVASLDLKNF